MLQRRLLIDNYSFIGVSKTLLRFFVGIFTFFFFLHLPQFSRHFTSHQWNKTDESLAAAHGHFTFLNHIYHLKLKLTQNKEGDLKNHNQKTRILSEIHNYIYSTLDRLQYKGDCGEKKFVRCSYKVSQTHASNLHRYVICLHIAFALDRTYFIEQPNDARYNDVGAFTLFDDGNCSLMKRNLTSIKDKCDFKDLYCYIDQDGLEIDNNYKLLEYTDEYAFPTPKYISGSLPPGIGNLLKRVGVRKPWHWFTSQLLGYLVMRPKEEFKKKFDVTSASMTSRWKPFNHSMIGLRIEGKGSRYMEYSHLKTYTKLVSKFSSGVRSSPPTKYVFLSSADPRTLKTARNLLNRTYIVKTSYPNETLTLPSERRASSMQRLLSDVYHLVHCDWLIVTHGSEIGELLWELKNSQFPYTGGNRVVTVNGNKFYHNWYNYQSLFTYFLTIRGNNKTLHYGNYKVIPYKKGELYFKKGSMTSSRKVVTSSMGSPVVIKDVQRVHVHPVVTGYVLERDLIVWPGRTFYKNDFIPL